MSQRLETGRLAPRALERRIQEGIGELRSDISHGELTVHCAPDRLLDLLRFCKEDEDLAFDMLMDVSGVHWPGGEHYEEPQISTTGWPPHRLTSQEGRIEVTYHLLSLERNHRLRIVVAVSDDLHDPPHVPSATEIYPTADFHEREVYDFFGVHFDGHPNLVRILMPEDWVGHPQRKDYPLGGTDTDYHGAFIQPPDQRVWSKDVPHAGGERARPGEGEDR